MSVAEIKTTKELKERIRNEKIYDKEMTQWVEGYNAGLERAAVILENEEGGERKG